MVRFSYTLLTFSFASFSATMARIFDPVVRDVEKLISEQVLHVKIDRMEAGSAELENVKVVPYVQTLIRKFGLLMSHFRKHRPFSLLVALVPAHTSRLSSRRPTPVLLSFSRGRREYFPGSAHSSTDKF